MTKQIYKNRKGRRKWAWITGVILLALAAALLFWPKGQKLANHTAAATTKVRLGSIRSTVIGTGNLAYDSDQKIQLPTGVLADELPALAGDQLTRGDVLAVLNPLSIQLEIAAAQDKLAQLDKQINSAKSSQTTESIKTYLAGRVKRIYVEKGDLAAEIYDREGALILLSLDGKMTLDIKAAGLAAGDKLDIILANGTVKEGLVEKITASAAKVTLTDNGPQIDEEVSVRTKSGQELGSASLLINEPLAIMATAGQVKSINVTENEKVASGRTLFSLTDLPASAEYSRLKQDREELALRLDRLFTLSQTNLLLADQDCVITSVLIEEKKPLGEQEDLVTAFIVAPIRQAVLSLLVDELDILDISIGMEAEIVLDAQSDQVFSGKINEIATVATGGSGLAKYPVQVLLDMEPVMRVGMNATATILVEEKKDILLLPVAALQESANRVYVYTQQDPETGFLSGEIDLTTGLSDGTDVEIISGLAEGETVYYPLAVDDLAGLGFGSGGLPGFAGRGNNRRPND